MITYLQILERLTQEESITKMAQRLEIEVTDKADAIEKYNTTFKPMFAGKNFDAHIFYHTPRSEGKDSMEYIEKIREEGFDEESTIVGFQIDKLNVIV